jgi:hypothetical protein
MTVG